MIEEGTAASGYRVEGRVQGVGFRWWCRRLAMELGVCGWVRNLPDGSVEICARGPEEAVRSLGAELWKGPWGARVESVRSVEISGATAERGFEILG